MEGPHVDRRHAAEHCNNRHGPGAALDASALRCNWCGMLSLPEDRPLVADHQLCGACFDLLHDIDWESLLPGQEI
jgi:hypothetical protein